MLVDRRSSDYALAKAQASIDLSSGLIRASATAIRRSQDLLATVEVYPFKSPSLLARAAVHPISWGAVGHVSAAVEPTEGS